MRWADSRLVRVAALWLLAAVAGAGALPAQASTVRKTATAVERAAEARAARKATSQYDETFKKYSKRYFGAAFDWTRFKAQAMAESGLDPNATSYVGARGLMQLMPSTYQMIQTKRPELGAINDPEWNIAAGIMHDRYLWKLWSKDVPEDERFNFMYASYNAGEGTIGRATKTAREKNLDHAQWATIESIAPTIPRWRYHETLGYVRKIDSYHTNLRGVKPKAPQSGPAAASDSARGPGKVPAPAVAPAPSRPPVERD